MGRSITRRVAAGLFVAALLGGGVARAAASVQIRGAAVRVVVIPEARRTIGVEILHAARSLPLKVRRLGDRVTILGNVARRVHGCGLTGGRQTVHIGGHGDTPIEALPQIVLRTPMDVRISAGDAAFGSIGRSVALDLTNQGCGTWTVADVAGRMRVDQAGAGVTRTGTAQTADLSVAGSGTLKTQAIAGGVTAVSSGAGDIVVARIDGAVDVRVAGAGTIRIAGGRAPMFKASIAGSGDVAFAGDVRDLDAMIAGPGQVKVGRVTGVVTKRVFGTGRVTVGP